MYEGDAPLAERRAAGAGARPRRARRADGARGAARAARRRRARRRRAAPAAPGAGAPGARSRRPRTTCCATSATSTRGEVATLRDAAAAPAWLAALEQQAARRGVPRRRRRALDRRRGCGPLSRRARGGAAAGAAERAARAGRADPLGDPGRALRPARTGRSPPPTPAARVRARRRGGAHDVLRGLAAQGRVVEGEFRPGGSGSRVGRCGRARAGCGGARWRCCGARSSPSRRKRWCALRRRGTTSRRLVPATLGSTRCWRAVEQLQGVPLPASALEGQILRAPHSRLLAGAARSARRHRRAGLGVAPARSAPPTAGSCSAQAELAPLLLPASRRSIPARRWRSCTLDALGTRRRALLPPALRPRRRTAPTPSSLAAILRSSCWNGHVTNDTLAPLRAPCAAGVGVCVARGVARPRAPASRAALAVDRGGPPAAAGPVEPDVPRATAT